MRETWTFICMHCEKAELVKKAAEALKSLRGKKVSITLERVGKIIKVFGTVGTVHLDEKNLVRSIVNFSPPHPGGDVLLADIQEVREAS